MYLIADSTCNLSPELIRKHRIQIAPISIQFGEETYEEDIDIDRPTFYAKIEEMGIIPTTSQPSPAWFAKFYRQAAEQGEQALVITITAKHSGTYDSALMAKSMVPEADVEVFDSASISLGSGWMVLEAVRASEAGQPRAQIIKRLERIRAAARLYLTPSTLKYLQMSGRVGRLQGALGSLLQVKPIIYLKNGVLEAGESIRTRQKAVSRLLELVEETFSGSTPLHLGVIHARVPEEAKALLERALKRLTVKEYLMEDLVASLAVHGGPGIIGLFAYPAEV